jgi:hypothetical protein
MATCTRLENYQIRMAYEALRPAISGFGLRRVLDLEPPAAWAMDFLPDDVSYTGVSARWLGAVPPNNRSFLHECPWATEWYFRDDYDGVVCLTFGDLPNKATALQRLLSSVKPGGLVVLGRIGGDGAATLSFAKERFKDVDHVHLSTAGNSRADLVFCRRPKTR